MLCYNYFEVCQPQMGSLNIVAGSWLRWWWYFWLPNRQNEEFTTKKLTKLIDTPTISETIHITMETKNAYYVNYMSCMNILQRTAVYDVLWIVNTHTTSLVTGIVHHNYSVEVSRFSPHESMFFLWWPTLLVLTWGCRYTPRGRQSQLVHYIKYCLMYMYGVVSVRSTALVWAMCLLIGVVYWLK